MTDQRYIDFDAALAEADEQPVVVRYKGRDWQLYVSLPAKPLMRLLRLQAEGQAENKLQQAEVVRFMSEMVPPDVLDAWLDEGMTVDEMGRVLRMVVAKYRGGEEPGEAPRPATGRSPSSSTGTRSKRTSGASTKSTSRRHSTT